MDWPDDTITRLRQLWAEGISTTEIGHRLGVSKNAVVGKAHRLDLPARPSPIRRDGEPRRPRTDARRTVPRVTLPSLDAPIVLVAPKPPRAAPWPIIVAPPPVAPVPAPRYGRVVPCCWPIGEPGTAAFRFCGVDSDAGRPYCAQHVALAYVRRREAVA